MASGLVMCVSLTNYYVITQWENAGSSSVCMCVCNEKEREREREREREAEGKRKRETLYEQSYISNSTMADVYIP